MNNEEVEKTIEPINNVNKSLKWHYIYCILNLISAANALLISIFFTLYPSSINFIFKGIVFVLNSTWNIFILYTMYLLLKMMKKGIILLKIKIILEIILYVLIAAGSFLGMVEAAKADAGAMIILFGPLFKGSILVTIINVIIGLVINRYYKKRADLFIKNSSN